MMRLGVDFDNTIICYDELFHRTAVERALIPADLPAAKGAIRDHLRAQPDGNRVWTELQAEVYGVRILEATPAPGVGRFFDACARRGLAVALISHKTEWPALGPRVSLREAAVGWLRAGGLLASDRFRVPTAFDVPESGVRGQGSGVNWPVYFESTRAGKLARVRQFECTHFIDDLEETFLEPGFPDGIERLLYAPRPPGVPVPVGPWRAFGSWAELEAYLLC